MKLKDVINVTTEEIIIYEKDWETKLLTLHNMDVYEASDLTDILTKNLLNAEVYDIKVFGEYNALCVMVGDISCK